jgi:hypothetical protein
VARFQPYLLPALRSIVSEMTTDVEAVIELLQITEQRQRLAVLDELLKIAIRSKLVGILPLPPYIADRLIAVLPAQSLFASEEDLPHHFPQCTQLDRMMPSEILQRLGSVEAFAVDGFEEEAGLLLRRSVVRVLQILPDHPRLFLHSLPHRPHHADLVMLARDESNVVRF